MPTPAHTAIRRRYRGGFASVVTPTVFTVGSTQGGTPRKAGCGPFDMHGVVCENERGWFAYLYGRAITKQRPFFHAPRVCGVLPCIKPTVKTVGASPRAYKFTERRRMAVWISANVRIPTTFIQTPPGLYALGKSGRRCAAQCRAQARKKIRFLFPGFKPAEFRLRFCIPLFCGLA